MIQKIHKGEVAAQQAEQHKLAGERSPHFKEALQKMRARRQAYARRQPTQRAGHAKLTMLHAKRLAHWAPLIARNAAKYGVPPELICGVMIQESGGNPKAKSHCGATGLMQLMPPTARRMGVTRIWDPAQNIEGGTRYLRYLMQHFKGDLTKVIAGYNAGEGAVAKYGGIPPYKETQNYVPRVKAYMRTVGSILGRGNNPGMMRTLVMNTMPRHAIANFRARRATRQAPVSSAASVARNMAKI
jgi:soluble lytic murein transglycosylase-like protein